MSNSSAICLWALDLVDLPPLGTWFRGQLIPYSANISRAINFADFTDFLQSVKIISVKMNEHQKQEYVLMHYNTIKIIIILLPRQLPVKLILLTIVMWLKCLQSAKFIFRKINILTNLRNYSPRNICAVQ